MFSLASWIFLYFLYWILILNHSPYSNVLCSALLGLTPPAYKAQDLTQLGLRGCQDHFHVHPGGCSPLPTCISNPILFLIEVQLIYNVVLIAAVQQSDSVICICMYIYIYILFHILFIMIYHGLLNIVPCAIQQDLVV